MSWKLKVIPLEYVNIMWMNVRNTHTKHTNAEIAFSSAPEEKMSPPLKPPQPSDLNVLKSFWWFIFGAFPVLPHHRGALLVWEQEARARGAGGRRRAAETDATRHAPSLQRCRLKSRGTKRGNSTRRKVTAQKEEETRKQDALSGVVSVRCLDSLRIGGDSARVRVRAGQRGIATIQS